MFDFNTGETILIALYCGQLLLVLGGLLLILQQVRWAGRAILAGIALVVAATLAPRLNVATGGGEAVIAWQWVAALVAVVAAAFRQWGAAIAFASPLAVKLFVWPTLSTLPLVIVVVVVALFAVGAVSRFLTAIWGPELAAHVVGTYVVRGIDGLFMLPFMLIGGLARMLGFGRRP